jgi:hypothetical protein
MLFIALRADNALSKIELTSARQFPNFSLLWLNEFLFYFIHFKKLEVIGLDFAAYFADLSGQNKPGFYSKTLKGVYCYAYPPELQSSFAACRVHRRFYPYSHSPTKCLD